MSEHLKFIVQELNKDPFNKNFNIISFDSIESLQLLQVVNDVIAVIDVKNKIDIREESIEQTCIRIMEMLQIFRYKPAVDQNNLNSLMQGLVIGDKLTIYPILDWLLSHINDLKKRAYLSRFMVMVQVPTEFLQDEEIARLYDQYEEVIQSFKETHKELETIKSSGVSTSDVKKDINTMQNEKEQLIKRVDRQRRKVESYPNSEPMLKMAKKLRTERDKESKLQHQIQEQKATLMTIDQKINRINQQVKEMRQIGATATPESLVQRQEEESRFNKLMVTEKLPKELAKNEKYIQDLQNVISEPAMSQSDLDKINKKIKEVNAEINRITETRMMSINTKEDKLIMFRQQASIVARKKDNAVEQLREVREVLSRTETELEEKRNKVLANAGKQTGSGTYEPVLRGEEFKKYVAQLRSKSNVYKPLRQALSELKAEQGILARTVELLMLQDDKYKNELNEIESKRGASGYWDAQDNLEKVSEQMSDINTRKGATLEDMSVMITKLTNSINSKKNNLIPMVKDVKPLRQKSQELQHIYDDKKQAYDSIMATYEVNRSKLDHEVKVLKEELKNLESRYHYITCMENMLKSNQTRLQEEMKIYLSQDPNEKKKSYREIYTKKINEQEALAKSLRERQKAIRESHGPNLKQRQMWSDLDMLLKCKSKCRQEQYQKESAGGIYSDVQQLEENRLIL